MNWPRHAWRCWTRGLFCAGAAFLTAGGAVYGDDPATAPAPPAEYTNRASHLAAGDVAGRVALAQWALEQKLYPQAADQATIVLVQEETQRTAALILQNADAAQAPHHDAAKEASLCAELEKRYGHSFKARDSAHYVICCDGTDQFAATRADLMERAYRNYLVHCTFPTLRPRPPAEPMVVILFADREDYRRCLADAHLPDLPSVTGVYLHTANRSIFYDDATNPAVLEIRKQREELQRRVTEIDAELATATSDARRKELQQLRQKTASDASVFHARETQASQILNDVTTFHEAAHQFAFNTGLQTPGVDYPKWLAEGFACGFEMQNEVGAHGLSVINWGRFASLKAEVQSGTLPPVRTLITLDTSKPVSAGEADHVYAEGWALVHYLYKYRRSDFEKLLQAYNALPPGKVLTPDDQLKMFTDIFGSNLAPLDTALLTYLRRF